MRPRNPLASAVLTLAFAISGAAVCAAQRRPIDLPDSKPAPDVSFARTCGAPVPTAQQQLAVSDAIRKYVDQFGAQAVGGQIKVAWHVIYSGSTGNIPQSQIDAQIAEMNKAYSGFYGGVNTGYTFVLASVDRTNNSKWFAMTPGTSRETQAKNALAIDPAHRLNIYSCKPGQSLLGWSYFPQDYPESNRIHGVVIHYGSVPGGYLTPYNLGGTADHETGHYLGLYHTFQGGCSGSGDQVSDTPAEGTATSGCPTGKDTCPTAGLDPIHNYMDYSDDACYTQFTAGQDARMDAIVPVYRPSLLNAAIAQEGARPVVGVTGPGGLSLAAAPNPFKGSTTMRCYLPRSGHVSLRVYNVAGQLVRTLVDGDLEPGLQTMEFGARGLAPGMYFASLRLGGEQINRTVILVR